MRQRNPLLVSKVGSVTLLLVLLLGAGATHGNKTGPVSSTDSPGIAIESLELPNGLKAKLLAVPQQRFDVRIRATAPILKGSNTSDASLNGLSKVLNTGGQGATVVALLSAGFNREDPLDPVGALIEDRKSLSPLSLATKTNGTLGRRYSLSGLLCISRAGQVTVETVDSFQASRGACVWGLQAGPLVVERDGRPAISTKEAARAHRLIACEPQDSGKGVEFYFFEDARLAEIEQGLRTRCSAALNLAGSIQAGILLSPRFGQGLAGQSDVPLPSVIVVQAKR